MLGFGVRARGLAGCAWHNCKNIILKLSDPEAWFIRPKQALNPSTLNPKA